MLVATTRSAASAADVARQMAGDAAVAERHGLAAAEELVDLRATAEPQRAGFERIGP
ncbi:MAG: hypothetical protein U1F30_16515 [Steroidobacteraceae bacterium]